MHDQREAADLRFTFLSMCLLYFLRAVGSESLQLVLSVRSLQCQDKHCQDQDSGLESPRFKIEKG